MIESIVAPSGVAVRGELVVFNDQSDNQQLKIFDVNSGEILSLENVSAESADLKYTWPQFIPDTNKIIATRGVRGTYGSAGIDLIELDSGEIKTIAPVGFKGRYAKSGHVVFVRGDALWAQPVDPINFENMGNAVPVVFGIEIYEAYGNAGFDFSGDGRFVYVEGDLSDDSIVSQPPVLVDRNGTVEQLQIDPLFYLYSRISPSGDRLAINSFDGGGGFDVWVYDFYAETLGRRTFHGNGMRAMWTDDGTRLIYACGVGNICSTAANGTDSESILASGFQEPTPYAQVNETELLITQGSPQQVYRLDLVGENEALLENLNLSPSSNSDVALSYDKNWIAYASDESGRREIYVRPFPNIAGGKWQVSRQGGRWPIWNENSNELIWWSESTSEILKSDYKVGSDSTESVEIRFSNPSLILETQFLGSTAFFPYDYNEETEKFVFISTTRSGSDILARQTKLRVIEDWNGELSSIAPAEYRE